MDGREAPIAKKDARVSSAVSPKRRREGLPVTDVLPPEVRRERMGDKCWLRERSITGSDDEGQKDEKKGARGRWREQEKERARCHDLANRVPRCCSRQNFTRLDARCFKGPE